MCEYKKKYVDLIYKLKLLDKDIKLCLIVKLEYLIVLMLCIFKKYFGIFVMKFYI